MNGFSVHDGEYLEVHWSGKLVVLSLLCCYFSSFASIDILDHVRRRDGLRIKCDPTGLLRFPIFFASLALAYGVWSLHFIGMAAHSLRISNSDERIAVSYWLPATVASFFLCWAGVYAGYKVASKDVFQSENRLENLKAIISGLHTGIKKLPKAVVVKHAMFGKLGHVLAAATLVTIGVCLMHYVGISAMTGPVEKDWNIAWILCSVGLCYIVATAGLWIIFRLLVWKDSTMWWLRQLSVAVITAAVGEMHYTSMHAVGFVLDSTVEFNEDGFHPEAKDFPTLMLALCLLVVFVELYTTVLDFHKTSIVTSTFSLDVLMNGETSWSSHMPSGPGSPFSRSPSGKFPLASSPSSKLRQGNSTPNMSPTPASKLSSSVLPI
ncbi:unnamed protein product [Chrysoparadoxa australica]